jgi:hypothetical protein
MDSDLPRIIDWIRYIYGSVGCHLMIRRAFEDFEEGLGWVGVLDDVIERAGCMLD